AVVARSAGELDPRTRTLFVELELDNSDHFLVAGSFAYVTLHVKLRSYPEVPASALLTRGNGAFLAAVGADGTVHLQPVSVVRTDGDRVLLGEGVKVGQGVAIDLPDEVADGGGCRRSWIPLRLSPPRGPARHRGTELRPHASWSAKADHPRLCGLERKARMVGLRRP
ncbi:MAG: hypothetical protein ABI369_15945, partial [Acetobacteraceae bacterium]